MERRRFVVDSYVGPDEAFHFARKELGSQRPGYAHFHDFHEVFIVEQGSLRHFINGRTELLDPGVAAFVRPQDSHAFQSVGTSPCRIINVMCRQETIGHLRNRYGGEFGDRFFWSGSELPFRHDLSVPRLERIVNAAMELQGDCRTLARLELFMLFLMTQVIDDALVLPPPAPAWLNAACEAAQLQEVFSKGARGFVEACGRGQEHVCRETKRHLGMSPSAFVNCIRMAHAARRLREGGDRIEDISLECGLKNTSHFHRLFRLHCGTTPSRYRRRHLTNPERPG